MPGRDIRRRLYMRRGRRSSRRGIRGRHAIFQNRMRGPVNYRGCRKLGRHHRPRDPGLCGAERRTCWGPPRSRVRQHQRRGRIFTPRGHHRGPVVCVTLGAVVVVIVRGVHHGRHVGGGRHGRLGLSRVSRRPGGRMLASVILWLSEMKIRAKKKRSENNC